MTPGPSRRKAGLSPDDVRVWRSLAQSVRPLPGKALSDVPEGPPPVDPTKPEPENTARLARMTAPPPQPPVKTMTDLTIGKPVDVDKNTGRRLLRGGMPIDGRLDLHGMVRDTAQGRLIAFIEHAYDRGLRCVLIITGKGAAGQGVLKAEVPRWLNLARLRPLIVAVGQAQPKDGGDGALYVLIRRKRA